MSVTFRSDAAAGVKLVAAACLCAQAAPGFVRAPANVLRAHADPHCAWCLGRGSETRTERDEPTLNLCNVNAHALLAMLRLIDDRAYLAGMREDWPTLPAAAEPPRVDELTGSASLPRFRRALVYAQNTFATRAGYFVRAPRTLRAARPQDDGTTALVDRVVTGGLDRQRLRHYLQALEHLGLAAEAHRATRIVWD